MLEKHVIVGVHITDRVEHATDVQKALTDFGSGIRTRLGLHDMGEEFASPNGLLLLEFVGSDEDCATMCDALNAITGVEVKALVFDHP